MQINLFYIYNNEVYMKEQQELELLLSTNKVARQAYNEKYNVTESERGVVKTVLLPDSIFLDEDQIALSDQIDNGNLFDIFDKL